MTPNFDLLFYAVDFDNVIWATLIVSLTLNFILTVNLASARRNRVSELPLERKATAPGKKKAAKKEQGAPAAKKEEPKLDLDFRLKQAEEAQVHQPAEGTPMVRSATPSGLERAGPLLAKKPKFKRPPILPRDIVGESIEIEDDTADLETAALARRS